MDWWRRTTRRGCIAWPRGSGRDRCRGHDSVGARPPWSSDRLRLVKPGRSLCHVLPATSVVRAGLGMDRIKSVGRRRVDPASATTATGDVVHNVLIATWFEGGVFALVGIVLVLLAAAATAWRAWAGSKSLESQRLAAALLAAVGSAIAFSMANPILFQRYVWVPVFLAIALVSHQARARVSASHKSASHKEAAFGAGVGRATMSARSSS